jgi:simple sugar transport system permease protein
MTLIEGVLASALVLAPVLVLTGLGGAIHQRSGIVNIALEGFVLGGAFAGIVIGDATGSVLVGLAAGAIAGGMLGWFYSAVVTRLGGNMIIVGLGLNTLLIGLVGLILSEQYGTRSSFRPTADLDATLFGLGFLEDVPILGTLLAGNDLVVWATVPAVLAVAWVIQRTRWGLRVRAVGSDPDAAATLGISAARVQDEAGLVAGVLSGIGGAHLAIVASGIFSPGISAGRGYIALAAVYFGRMRPIATTFAALIYVVLDAAQSRLQLRVPGIPQQLVEVLPYAAVIAVLTISMLPRRRHETA